MNNATPPPSKGWDGHQSGPRPTRLARENARLARENERLAADLAKAQVVIEVQGKLPALLDTLATSSPNTDSEPNR